MKQQPIAADQTTTTTKLLRKPAVLERVPMSDTTLWRRVKDGGFPAPVRISTNAIAWRESDVDAWIAARAQTA